MKGTRPLDNDETGCSGLLVQDSNLPIFHQSDTLLKLSSGGIATRRQPNTVSATLLP